VLDREEINNELRGADLIHFSGHGLSWLTGSGLLLSGARLQDAVLITPDSVDELGTSGRKKLVFLAACSTARGAQRSLLDPNSLVLSFLRAGTQSVIASRWAVDSAATSALTHNFYDEIDKGKSADEALSVAMGAARATSEHPYYWAGFSTFNGGLPSARH
jgi:CHAT domain-containing protein